MEIVEMDKLGINFLDLSRDTFKDFTVGKAGQEKHILWEACNYKTKM